MSEWRRTLTETLTNGKAEDDRTGTGVIRQCGVLSRHNMLDGFPLESLKWTNFEAIRDELLWMISGSTNIRWLKTRGVGIWDAHVIPETAEVESMHYWKVVTRTMEMKDYDFDKLVAALTGACKKLLDYEPLLVTSVVGPAMIDRATDGVVSRHMQIFCERRSDNPKKDQLNVLTALVGSLLQGGVNPEVLIKEVPLYSYDQQPGWLKDIHNMYTPGTFWPIELVAGELGPIYGRQWRHVPHHLSFTAAGAIFEDYATHIFEGETVEQLKKGFMEHMQYLQDNVKGIDQLQVAVDEIINDPVGRRTMVNSWNVSMLDEMSLPPCHFNFQFFSEKLAPSERFDAAMALDEDFDEEWKEECWEASQQNYQATPSTYMDNNNFPDRGLSIIVTMRSNDAYLGEPFNTAQYALLLHMVAQVTNHYPKEVILFRGDYHIYANHVDTVKEVLQEVERPKCRLKLNRRIKNIFDFKPEDISVKNYTSGPYRPAPMAVRRES